MSDARRMFASWLMEEIAAFRRHRTLSGWIAIKNIGELMHEART